MYKILYVTAARLLIALTFGAVGAGLVFAMYGIVQLGVYIAFTYGAVYGWAYAIGLVGFFVGLFTANIRVDQSTSTGPPPTYPVIDSDDQARDRIERYCMHS